jgi:hypothetical protein
MYNIPDFPDRIDTAFDVYVAWVDARRAVEAAERVESEAQDCYLRSVRDFSDDENEMLLTRIGKWAYECAGQPYKV